MDITTSTIVLTVLLVLVLGVAVWLAHSLLRQDKQHFTKALEQTSTIGSLKGDLDVQRRQVRFLEDKLRWQERELVELRKPPAERVANIAKKAVRDVLALDKVDAPKSDTPHDTNAKVRADLMREAAYFERIRAQRRANRVMQDRYHQLKKMFEKGCVRQDFTGEVLFAMSSIMHAHLRTWEQMPASTQMLYNSLASDIRAFFSRPPYLNSPPKPVNDGAPASTFEDKANSDVSSPAEPPTSNQAEPPTRPTYPTRAPRIPPDALEKSALHMANHLSELFGFPLDSTIVSMIEADHTGATIIFQMGEHTEAPKRMKHPSGMTVPVREHPTPVAQPQT